MIKRFNPDFSLSISHELAYMRETPEGGYVAHGDYATLFSKLEVVKADRDALAERVERLSGMLTESRHATKAAVERADALAVENAAQGAALSLISGCYGLSPHIQSMCAVETPATSAALAAIEARFCGLLDHYGKVEPERFNPEFADLYAKIVNRIFSSVMDNPSVTDLESLTDWLENSAENARAYADMSIKFHAELREAK